MENEWRTEGTGRDGDRYRVEGRRDSGRREAAGGTAAVRGVKTPGAFLNKGAGAGGIMRGVSVMGDATGKVR